jgi:hypothetical protein
MRVKTFLWTYCEEFAVHKEGFINRKNGLSKDQRAESREIFLVFFSLGHKVQLDFSFVPSSFRFFV